MHSRYSAFALFLCVLILQNSRRTLSLPNALPLAGVARRGCLLPLRCESTAAGHPRVGLACLADVVRDLHKLKLFSLCEDLLGFVQVVLATWSPCINSGWPVALARPQTQQLLLAPSTPYCVIAVPSVLSCLTVFRALASLLPN